MFKEGQGVIVEGQLNDQGSSMKSKTLMVKHSEDIKSSEDHHSEPTSEKIDFQRQLLITNICVTN